MDIKPPKSQSVGVTRRQTRRPIGEFNQPIGSALPSSADKPESTSAKAFTFDTSDIDAEEVKTLKKKSRFGWLKWFNPAHVRRNFSPKRFFKKSALFLGALVVGGVGFIGFKLFFAAQNIIDRDSGGALALQGNIDPSQLSGEGDGRVNILLIGTGGDGHQGGTLADTIIVASIDPFNNDVAMVSIPRDLLMPVPDNWSMKVNAAHATGEANGFHESGYPDGGPGLLQKTLEQTLDIPIHYYLRVDFDGFLQAIDAVNGISIDVPESVCDYKIAWEYGFSCIESGKQDFDSNKALFYARTRATARSDFDRGERQRLLLLALQQKVLSLGTFSNPLKMSSLLDAAGSHVRTNLQIGEMLRIYEIGETIKSENVVSAEIVEYITSAGDGTTDYVPKGGSFEELQKYIRSIFVDGFIKQEGAIVDVLNGTDVIGAATQVADDLASYGYTLGFVDDAPDTGYTATRLYDMNGDNPFTKRYLEQRFGTFVLNSRDLPSGVTSEADFVLIIGQDATR
jgi:LCP family protein required for cell wall assembly